MPVWIGSKTSIDLPEAKALIQQKQNNNNSAFIFGLFRTIVNKRVTSSQTYVSFCNWEILIEFDCHFDSKLQKITMTP